MFRPVGVESPRHLPLALLLATVAMPTLTAQPKADGPPTAADPRLVVEQFAAAPDIVQPIALDFDSKGRLLVVESHTHFRPAKYTGPRRTASASSRTPTATARPTSSPPSSRA